jgi:hypothetical protein
MDMDLHFLVHRECEIELGIPTHPIFQSEAFLSLRARAFITYNGYLAAELVLNFSFFEGVWGFLPDEGEELLNTHLGDIFCSLWSYSCRVTDFLISAAVYGFLGTTRGDVRKARSLALSVQAEPRHQLHTREGGNRDSALPM